ncbi:hypothetical protein QJ854_gp506 [Moumouvirus goulette]|uniref:Uncharacterized protein n=1 Tax=Moumouvirus goulette TaxID=1247379 RepID=M1PMS2_9VIRU|nr:hypothetical protein QJ854_gp506 [Moumouvirus goulette]AGF85276.1 hypothetical protein glt_00467 [Moumouvirus goulette]
MDTFILTPTNTKYLDFMLKDPISGNLIAPVMNFNLDTLNPFKTDLYFLNSDNKYQEKITNYIHTSLTEKWLYKEEVYNDLLKYFRVTKHKTYGTVCLINNLTDKVNIDINNKYKNHIFRYIEKFFITPSFVEKVLQNYVENSKIKWYDVCSNKNIIKALFAYKLKKVFIKIINKKNNTQTNK